MTGELHLHKITWFPRPAAGDKHIVYIAPSASVHVYLSVAEPVSPCAIMSRACAAMQCQASIVRRYAQLLNCIVCVHCW